MTTNEILQGIFFLLLFFLVFTAPRLFLRRNQKAARDEAVRLGIEVEEVQEGAPVFSSFAETQTFLEDEHYVRYSLKRVGSSPSHWAILQRLEMKDSKYPESWLMFEGVRYPPEIWFLVVKDGVPSECLVNCVKRIASIWTEEYLEFEGTPTEVRAYWDESGGPRMAEIIHQHLTRLRQC